MPDEKWLLFFERASGRLFFSDSGRRRLGRPGAPAPFERQLGSAAKFDRLTAFALVGSAT